jgi:hypothetical protein
MHFLDGLLRALLDISMVYCHAAVRAVTVCYQRRSR